MLYIAGISITFFLALILASKKNKSTADEILTYWLFVIGVHLVLYYLLSSQKYLQFPFLLGLEIPMPLLHGPFLFLYTTSLTSQHPEGRKRLLHFVPFVIGVLILIPFFTLAVQEKITVYQNEGESYARLMNVIFASIVLSGISYTLLSLKSVRTHRKMISEEFSFTEHINLKWLLNLIIGSSIIWLLVIFSDDKYIFAAVVLYVLFIGYFGIKQVAIFSNIPQAEYDEPDITTELVTESRKPKYEKSSLSEADIRYTHQKLEEIMQAKQPFKNPKLTLTDLANELDVNPNTLSQVINSVEQKNFYDYVNSYRIEEFERLIKLPENQNFTLLALAFECGFNSKTSFNRNFKKVTGLSPSEFLKEKHISMK